MLKTHKGKSKSERSQSGPLSSIKSGINIISCKNIYPPVTAPNHHSIFKIMQENNVQEL